MKVVTVHVQCWIWRLIFLLHCMVMYQARQANCSTDSAIVSADHRQVLYLLVTGPYPDPLDIGWDQGISLIPAVRLAFKQINNRTDILDDYRLELVEDNSGCRNPGSIPTIGINSFIESVYYTRKRIMGIIGPACSDTTLALAPILSREPISLIQIAPTATSPVIEFKNYSTTFTMISSSLAYINSFVALMNRTKWTQVATLFDELGGNFKATHIKFVEKINSIPEYSITYTSYVYDSDKQNLIHLPLQDLRKSQARVVQVFAGRGTVQKIICLAYHLNMIYPQYQWVFSERRLKDFKTNVVFSYDGIEYNCSKQEMAVASNGSILNTYSLIQDDNEILSVTNQSYSFYRELYEQEFQKHLFEQKTQDILTRYLESTTNKTRDDYSKPTGTWENTYYDAAWAMGFALDNASKTGLNLSEYNLGQPEFTKTLADMLLKVQFTGATGPVQFNQESRSVQTRIIINQLLLENKNMSKLMDIYLAEYSNRTLQLNRNISFIRDTYAEVPLRIHYAVGIIIIVITFIVTICTVLLQFAFIIWHYKTSIKATSPNISHLIFSGCYLFSLATILYAIQQTFELELQSAKFEVIYAVLCNTITWCLLLGFSLIFGTVFVKVWRMFRLFKHFRNERPGRFLSDDALITTGIVFLFLDMIICIAWNLINPWMLQRDIQNVFKSDNPTVLVQYSCTCQNIYYWIGGVAAYKGTIAILLLVFSILNRKIQRKNFSHTKQVNILVYSITLLGGVGYPLYFLLNGISSSIYPSFIIFCVVLLMTVIMCCLMLFLPPVVPIIKGTVGIDEEETFSTHFKRKLSVMSTVSFLSTSSDPLYL